MESIAEKSCLAITALPKPGQLICSFLLWQESQATINKHLEIIRYLRHDRQSCWLKNIGCCQETLHYVPGAEAYALVEDAMLEECCWHPAALYAHLLWKTDLPEGDILKKLPNGAK